MKTTFLKLTAFAFCATVLISSCDDKPKENPVTPPSTDFKPCAITAIFGSDTIISEYDAKLRLVRETYKEFGFPSEVENFTYGNSTFVVDGDTVALDANGRATTFDGVIITYNADGFVSKVEVDSSFNIVCTYANGNLVKQVFNDGGENEEFTYEYYTDKLDRYRLNSLIEDEGLVFLQRFTPVFGNASKNLLKKVTVKEDGSENSESFTYQFNAAGLPTKITAVSDGSEIAKFSYAADCGN